MESAPLVYLDHAASTPVAPMVVEAMMPFLDECYGNPSGAHVYARRARRAVDDARDVLAELLGVAPAGVVFTSGGTESDNLAVLGVHDRLGGTVVCSAIEHHAVLAPVEQRGGRVVAADRAGVVDLDRLAAALDETVTLVSTMAVNNETGVVQPIDEIAAVVRDRAPNAVVHCDAVQAAPWLDIADHCCAADLLTISGHKIGAPKGIGVLAVADGVELAPRLIGGGQERERRAGTPNVPGIVAMGVAARRVADERNEAARRVTSLRDRLLNGILADVADAVEVGSRDRKVPGIANVCLPGVESEALLFVLERYGICASAAASCASGAQDPSHVLAAMGYDRELAGGSLRLSLGYDSTDADIDAALAAVPASVAQLRSAA